MSQKLEKKGKVKELNQNYMKTDYSILFLIKKSKIPANSISELHKILIKKSSYNPTWKTFFNGIKRLEKKGLIKKVKGTYFLTEDGNSYLLDLQEIKKYFLKLERLGYEKRIISKIDFPVWNNN